MAVLAIFADLIHECVEVYMDDFSVYGNEFDDSLQNLEKVLIRCIESNLSLSNEKCFMLLTKGIVFGHHISPKGIKVHTTKVEIILKLLNPKSQKDDRIFFRLCMLLSSIH